MSQGRDVRRLAFQLLFQLDAQGYFAPARRGVAALEAEAEDLRKAVESDEHAEGLTAKERESAAKLAFAAFVAHPEADAVMVKLAPTWPPHRQAAVDRAILRLAFHEMHHGKAPPKVVVNDAVELAKLFSTEKSPAFINGLLDKVLKDVLAKKGEPGPAGGMPGGSPQEAQKPSGPAA
jgi:N utilization substance protein B